VEKVESARTSGDSRQLPAGYLGWAFGMDSYLGKIAGR